jgi:hypothetical protein
LLAALSIVPLAAQARSDDPPAPDKQPIEHAAPDSGAPSSEHPAPTEFRLNPLGDFFHDLHRALSGRKSTSSVNPPTPPTSAASAYQPFQLIPTSGNLFGDWFGARTYLEEKGITTSLSFVTNLAGNVNGGRDQGFTHADNLGLDFHFDLETILGLEGASFLLNMSQRFEREQRLHRQRLHRPASLRRQHLPPHRRRLPTAALQRPTLLPRGQNCKWRRLPCQ